MARRSATLAAAIALAAALTGCATPTPYQPNIPGQAVSGGYSETKIESNRWRVTFAGNTLTSRETVEGYLLFRAAEPGPVASTSGKCPKTVAAEVINTGRSRVNEASRIASILAIP